jgi:hypothetical protein
MLHNRRHGVSLHCVVEVNLGRKMLTQKVNPIRDALPVISIEWGSAYPLHQPLEGHASNLKAVVAARELNH